MISCLLNQPALRRHLDEGAPLTRRARAHVDRCSDCRAVLQSHLAIIRHLSAGSGEPGPVPSFLHARVMNGLRHAEPAKDEKRVAPRWAMAIAGFGAVTVFIALMVLRDSPIQTPSWPDVHSDIAFQTTLPANPLQTEIDNLRMDTLNATKALAASFMLEPDSEK